MLCSPSLHAAQAPPTFQRAATFCNGSQTVPLNFNHHHQQVYNNNNNGGGPNTPPPHIYPSTFDPRLPPQGASSFASMPPPQQHYRASQLFNNNGVPVVSSADGGGGPRSSSHGILVQRHHSLDSRSQGGLSPKAFKRRSVAITSPPPLPPNHQIGDGSSSPSSPNQIRRPIPKPVDIPTVPPAIANNNSELTQYQW